MEREYVGIDLHRRRSVIVRKNADGEVVSKTHIDNDPLALAQAVAAAGPEPEVVLEATFGWYWAADLLQEMGARVHLAHPLGNNWGNRRVKNDERDAADLVDLLRLGRLAESWIAPPEIRELREMTRYRHKLMRLRSGLKAQVHAVMGKNGVLPSRSDMFGLGGTAQLDALELPMAYSLRLESLRDLIELYRREIEILDRRIHLHLKDDPGYRAIQAIHGVGPVLAAVFVAEIGDVSRFPSPDRLCSWAGLTPRHRESDTKVRRGSITKQGSRLVRWAAVEAISRNHGGDKIKADYRRIAERRGRNIGRVAAARRVLRLVYYGLRDGQIRCLTPAETG
ncbi:MAG TPA: IS110 family transposase [Acidimicrobiales bacterium]|nr:IS110 family transposase [Acidimicrobiales bacterium]